MIFSESNNFILLLTVDGVIGMQYPLLIISAFTLLCACKPDRPASTEPEPDIVGTVSCSDKKLLTDRDRRSATKISKAAEHYYDHVLSRSGFNGGMLVSFKGCIVFERYRGREVLRDGPLMDSTSSVHLASVSKTLTGMAIVKLGEEGKLKLDDPVSTYLKEFPLPDVTVRHLLNHRSGLPNYVHFMESIGWDQRVFVKNEDILYTIRDHRRKLDIGRPNRRFNYSNTNYALLALIVERVTGKPFPAYMKETFFQPLGMKDTYVYTAIHEQSAIPSFNAFGHREPMMFLDRVYGDKNIYSTPRDLLKWDQALYNGRLFSEQALEQAYRGYSYERHGTRNYGLGWRLIDHGGGRKIIYHNGWWHGNNTVFSRFPMDSAAVIVLGNRYNRRIYDVKKIYSEFPGYGYAMEDPE
jgi:CubicO group peptidase (beta-lactamase class C family)